MPVRHLLPGHCAGLVGLPLLNGFIGEFLVLSGAFQARPIYGILAATGVIWSAGYLLWMYQRVFFGKVTREVNNTLPDLNLREKAALSPIAIAALVMAWPRWFGSARLIRRCNNTLPPSRR